MLGKLKAMAITAALCGFASMSASAAFLTAGESLQAGQGLASHDGRYSAVLQWDGNFVVNRVADGAVIFNAGTAGSGATQAVMQEDGNFVLYSANGTAVWWTGTFNQQGALPNEFTVDDQGMAAVVAYVPVWGTVTNTQGNPSAPSLYFQYGFQFQQGVIYNGPNGNQWIFQTDGNLVLYHNSVPVWASNVTKNKKGGRATYAQFDSMLSVWNDAGNVFGAGSSDQWWWPAGFHRESAADQPLRLNGDQTLFAIQYDGNAVIWAATRQWGAPTYDPAPSTLPPASGPHCVGDPHYCLPGPVFSFPISGPL